MADPVAGQGSWQRAEQAIAKVKPKMKSFGRPIEGRPEAYDIIFYPGPGPGGRVSRMTGPGMRYVSADSATFEPGEYTWGAVRSFWYAKPDTGKSFDRKRGA